MVVVVVDGFGYEVIISSDVRSFRRVLSKGVF